MALFAAVAPSVAAQDLIARQAPVDHRVKAVDSVVLHRIIEAEVLEAETADFYTSWINNKVHCYAANEVPDSFNIDLRGFCMPTPSRKVTSGFGYRPRFRRMHKGLDVKVYTGDTICSAFDGKVRMTGYERNGYGHFVVIRHNNGLETIYGHLSKRLVKPDDEVKAGEVIGLGGNTGRSYGSHLHFETRIAGVAINPALLFDFANQDVVTDYYMFRNDRSSSALAYNTPNPKKTYGKSGSGIQYYKIRKGDSLSRIAQRTGTSVSRLCSLNRLSKTSILRVGQVLKY